MCESVRVCYRRVWFVRVCYLLTRSNPPPNSLPLVKATQHPDLRNPTRTVHSQHVVNASSNKIHLPRPGMRRFVVVEVHNSEESGDEGADGYEGYGDPEGGDEGGCGGDDGANLGRVQGEAAAEALDWGGDGGGGESGPGCWGGVGGLFGAEGEEGWGGRGGGRGCVQVVA